MALNKNMNAHQLKLRLRYPKQNYFPMPSLFKGIFLVKQFLTRNIELSNINPGSNSLTAGRFLTKLDLET
jgi:hypothetical protein